MLAALAFGSNRIKKPGHYLTGLSFDACTLWMYLHLPRSLYIIIVAFKQYGHTMALQTYLPVA